MSLDDEVVLKMFVDAISVQIMRRPDLLSHQKAQTAVYVKLGRECFDLFTDNFDLFCSTASLSDVLSVVDTYFAYRLGLPYSYDLTFGRFSCSSDPYNFVSYVMAYANRQGEIET